MRAAILRSNPTHSSQLNVDDAQNLYVNLAVADPSVVIPVTISNLPVTTVCGSVSSNTQIAVAIASKYLKVIFVSLRTSYSAGAIVPILTDGNAGTTIYQDLEQAISGSVSGSVASASPYICKTSINTALYLNPNGQTVYYTVSYIPDVNP